MAADVRILGVDGSLSCAQNVNTALRTALRQAAREGAQTQEVHLRDVLQEPFWGDIRQEKSEAVGALVNQVIASDAIIIATPTHWFNVSSLTKIFIDHLTDLEEPKFSLQGRVVGVIATCEEDGGNQACMNMIAPLLHLGCIVPPYGAIFRNLSAGGGEAQWQDRDFALLGMEVVLLAKLTRDVRKLWDYKNMK
jgi:multimeric flavodoxin WrbA